MSESPESQNSGRQRAKNGLHPENGQTGVQGDGNDECEKTKNNGEMRVSKTHEDRCGDPGKRMTALRPSQLTPGQAPMGNEGWSTAEQSTSRETHAELQQSKIRNPS